MEILLINPPSPKRSTEVIIIEPLGLGYIAAVLLENKFNVQILDLFAEKKTLKDLEKILKKRSINFDIIGITGMTPTKDMIYKTAKIVRDFCNFLILGGSHASSYKQKIFSECDVFDLVVDGEGEKTIIDLCKSIAQKESFDEILGIITKNKVNPRRELIKDIEKIPFPARHLLPMNKYRYVLSSKKNAASLFTSRGCPYNCIFCEKNVFGQKWRFRSAENIIEEIEEIITNYNIFSFIFYDDLFTVNKKRVLKFCELIIKKKLNIEWKCEGRVNIVDYEVLCEMKKAGCMSIAYGIETFNQNGLDFLNKGTKSHQIYNAIKLTKKAGIKTVGYFILGIPTETYEQELYSIKEAKRIGIDYPQFNLLRPHENTKLYSLGKEKGWICEGSFNNPDEKDKKRKILISENWTIEKINKILEKSYLEFMFDPRYIIKTIKGVRTYFEMIKILLVGIKYMKWYIKKKLKMKITYEG